jgi:NhaP-type Na+/H+ or K+/H+ antiporter
MSQFLTRFAPYRKTVVAIVGTVITWLAVAYVPDGHITRAEWYGLIIAIAAALGVYVAPNDPKPTNPVAAAIPPTTSNATVLWQAASQSQTEAP